MNKFLVASIAGASGSDPQASRTVVTDTLKEVCAAGRCPVKCQDMKGFTFRSQALLDFSFGPDGEPVQACGGCTGDTYQIHNGVYQQCVNGAVTEQLGDAEYYRHAFVLETEAFFAKCEEESTAECLLNLHIAISTKAAVPLDEVKIQENHQPDLTGTGLKDTEKPYSWTITVLTKRYTANFFKFVSLTYNTTEFAETVLGTTANTCIEVIESECVAGEGVCHLSHAKSSWTQWAAHKKAQYAAMHDNVKEGCKSAQWRKDQNEFLATPEASADQHAPGRWEMTWRLVVDCSGSASSKCGAEDFLEKSERAVAAWLKLPSDDTLQVWWPAHDSGRRLSLDTSNESLYVKWASDRSHSEVQHILDARAYNFGEPLGVTVMHGEVTSQDFEPAADSSNQNGEDEEDSGISGWVWAVVAIGILATIALVAVALWAYARRSRKRSAEADVEQGSGPAADPAKEADLESEPGSCRSSTWTDVPPSLVGKA